MVKFKINNRNWEIREIDKQWLIDKYNSEHEKKCYFAFGVTIYPEQTIYINNEMHKEQKIATLKHELMHCWLWCHGVSQMTEYMEEDICEFVSASNDFINEVIEKYKKQMR